MTAILSPDGIYRYRLTREVAPLTGEGKLTWIMLNPSTADAVEDDPTIGRCMGFTRREGFAEMEVVNLFALRSTDPRALEEGELTPDPTGPLNAEYLEEALREADRIVVAWGVTKPGSRRARHALAFREAAKLAKRGLWCLGENADGSPKHPLYVPGDQPLLPYGP